MSMLDKIKSMLSGHEDTVRSGVDKAGDAVNDKTQGKYGDPVDSAEQKINDQLGGQAPPTSDDSHPPQN
ncbi:antitoxin [Kitasatospora sp. MAP5-34]|uniref:antitoxin n=1 Tax=Kitasatospora sp. MAP5-34 TaxID=3035102 RepID=UPI0024734698|nr:antitoxin [Kitasatospora sp. MAP5-34]MDH6577759.1 hypothetical protein [Kitasatospora sp. MAP5-34]